MLFFILFKILRKKILQTLNLGHQVHPNVQSKYSVSEFKFRQVLVKTSPLKVHWTKIYKKKKTI